jgi:tRNA A37 threonylcarbamoyladenosine synthetase subunit TsaC/SUA5/YrdC
MIIAINPHNPQIRLIRKVVEVLREGGVIAYPTDTIYGLGCDLYRKDGQQKIRQLKKHRWDGRGFEDGEIGAFHALPVQAMYLD